MCCRFQLPLLFQFLDIAIMMPSDFMRKLAEEAKLMTRLEPQNLQSIRDDHSLHLVIGLWNSLESLQVLQGSCTTFSFMGNHSSDSPPQNARWSAEMNGPLAGLGVHPLSQEAQVFHLLSDDSSRQTDLLNTDCSQSLSNSIRCL